VESLTLTVNFNKKLLLRIVLFLSIVMTVTINNYFFYKHLDKDLKRDILLHANIVHHTLNHCKQSQISLKSCQLYLKTTLIQRPTHYGVNIVMKKSLVDIYEINNRKNSLQHTDVVKLSDITKNKDLTYNELFDIEIEIFKANSPNLVLGVMKSLTFSIFDWMPLLVNKKYKEALLFIQYVAIPRSWPALLLSILLAFIYILISKDLKLTQLKHEEALKHKDKALYEEQKNDVVSLSLENLIEKIQPYTHLTKEIINIETINYLIQHEPDTIILKCRKVSEMVAKNLVFNKISYNGSFFETINNLYQHKDIGNEAYSYFHTIRVFGNLAAHSVDKSEELTVNHAFLVLNTMVLLLDELQRLNLLTKLRT
jgi:hypothetical protein